MWHDLNCIICWQNYRRPFLCRAFTLFLCNDLSGLETILGLGAFHLPLNLLLLYIYNIIIIHILDFSSLLLAAEVVGGDLLVRLVSMLRIICRISRESLSMDNRLIIKTSIRKLLTLNHLLLNLIKTATIWHICNIHGSIACAVIATS